MSFQKNLFKTVLILAFLIGLILLISSWSWAQAYKTNSQDCYNYPRVASLETSTNICVGLVADLNSIPWVKPRKILFTDKNTAYVSDMGGWKPHKGSLWQLKFHDFQLVSYNKVFQHTDRTHGLALSQDQSHVYYGDATQIFRFDPKDPLATRQLVVDELPDSYTYKSGETSPSSHPLSEFELLPNNDLIINVGAPSNDCSDEYKKFKACHQRDKQAELRYYKFEPKSQAYFSDYEVLAKGLRNSMGLAYNFVTHQIMQAENSADKLGTPDELNIVDLNSAKVQDFAWPFCAGLGKRYAGYSNFVSFCAQQARKPFLLFPPHSAPLDLIYYQGAMLSKYQNSLMVSWHGHRPSGSRIAIYSTDAQLYPISNSPQFLVDGWQKDPQGMHPKGRPVGLDYDANGAIYVLDDVNATLLVVAKTNVQSQPQQGPTPQTVYTHTNLEEHLSKNAINQWPFVFKQAITGFKCQTCHRDVVNPQAPKRSLAEMLNRGWVETNKNFEDQLLWQKMTGAKGVRIMPPAPDRNILKHRNTPNSAYDNLKNWLNLL